MSISDESGRTYFIVRRKESLAILMRFSILFPGFQLGILQLSAIFTLPFNSTTIVCIPSKRELMAGINCMLGLLMIFWSTCFSSLLFFTYISLGLVLSPYSNCEYWCLMENILFMNNFEYIAELQRNRRNICKCKYILIYLHLISFPKRLFSNNVYKLHNPTT